MEFIDQENLELNKKEIKKFKKLDEKRNVLTFDFNVSYGSNLVKTKSEKNDINIFVDVTEEHPNNLIEELSSLGIKLPSHSDFNYHFEINNGNVDCIEFAEFLPQEIQHFILGYIEPIQIVENKVFNDHQYEPRELIKQNFNISFYDIENIYTTRSILQEESGILHKDTKLLATKKYTNSGWTYSYGACQGIDSIAFGEKYIKNK